ncbi:protein of unknown function [Taphrina deformans PYCC 5710]|uniref:Uncharacterized protein n=1 Tax=Taphrina deformans (strain PYCC 5710 / ATCC 11124 / CBS 356.35 / IMI 108563 / JCM 9778 / NBRC 8474) TaxID=1097556 RepID=R4XLW1_TAPDE|nr:protein of unknown function [Taphrina deformans PYCC 5710]|eukprot:CCG84280.1 protein of unknown function [Taphrina deformans PYCC 5710]
MRSTSPQYNPPQYAPRSESSRPAMRGPGAINMIVDILGIYVILGIGACIQLLAALAGLWYAPPLLLILGPALRNALVWAGLMENQYLERVAFGRTSGKSPNVDEEGNSTGELGVIKIGFRSNSPLGLLHPSARVVSRNFMEMITYLTTHADESGYLNHENYLATDRPSNNSLIVFFYFKSWHDIHRFAHGMHMKGWREFARLSQEQVSEIEIWHESYMISKSESIYVNTEPTGMGNLWHRLHPEACDEKHGTVTDPWINSLASITKSSSSKMRIGSQ